MEGIIQNTLGYINNCNKMMCVEDLVKNDVFWVLSYNSICDEMGKELLKKCAKEAGMNHFDLVSSGVASLFWTMNASGRDFKFKQGDKLMLLDIGGSTVDAECIETKKRPITKI